MSGMKMSLRTKYTVLKAITIVLGALSIPWSTYVGFCFGEGRYSTGVVALCAQTVVSLVDGYIWFWVLENMKRRLEEQPSNAAKRIVRKEHPLICAACGQSLSQGTPVLRCQCGYVSHPECWERHILTSHCPSFKVGYITPDNRFEPGEAVSLATKGTAASGTYQFAGGR
jgi:hypothetical protein